VIDFFNEETPLEETIVDMEAEFYEHLSNPEFDFADVKEQESIKRAMKIAAAGGHNIILFGPLGSGKKGIAIRLSSIFSLMSLHESLETTKIHSVAGRTVHKDGMMTARPFRSPHHTISDVVLLK
jgi:magnesium chelatase family protein